MSADVPSRLFVELTTRCNLRCRHCYRDAGKGQPMLDYDALRARFAELHRGGLRFVSLTGGEPTLHPRCGDIIRDLLDIGVRVAIASNGMAKRTRSLLVEFGQQLAGLQLSIEGVGPVHDAVRGPGTHARLLTTLELLERHAIPFDLQVTVGRHNYADLPALLDAARTWTQLRRIQLTPLLPLGRAQPSACLTRDQMRGLHRLRALAQISPFAIDTEVVDRGELDRVHRACVEGGAAGLLWWLRSDGGIGPWPSSPPHFDVGDLEHLPSPWLGGAAARDAWLAVERALSAGLRRTRPGQVVDTSRLVIEALQTQARQDHGARWN